MSEESEAREALATIPALADEEGPLVRLGGMTNRVYRVGAFCLRIPGKGTKNTSIARTRPSRRARRRAPGSRRMSSMQIPHPASWSRSSSTAR